MHWKPLVLAAALTSLAAPAQADDGDDDEFDRQLAEVSRLVHAKDFETADTIVDALLAKGDPTQRTQGEQVFCAHSESEAIIYAGMAATPGGLATVVGASYCDALFIKAYLDNELGRPEQALAVLGRLRGLAPLYPQYAAEMAYALRPTGDHQQMLENYQVVLDSVELLEDEGSKKHYMALALRGQGWVYADMKRWAEAEAALQESLIYEPDNPMALGELEYIAGERAR